MLLELIIRPNTTTGIVWSLLFHVGMIVAGIAWLPAVLEQVSMSGDSNVVYVEFSSVPVEAKKAKPEPIEIEKPEVEPPPEPIVEAKDPTPIEPPIEEPDKEPTPADSAEKKVAGTDERTPPNLSSNRPPVYPREAIRRGLEGTVLLRLYIATSGKIERVEIERSSGHTMLDRSAAAAVRRWNGRPALLNGEPVASEEVLPVKFRLSNAR